MNLTKRLRIAGLAGTAALGLAGCQASPQAVPTLGSPLVPPTPTPLAPNMLGVAPGGLTPGPVTVWQKLGLGKQQREMCLRAFCKSPAGMLMNRAISPMSKMTGGLLPPLCSPIPTAGELLDPGAIGASSKAKMDKANAEARKKAVEELGGLDCHYWPEAEDALIGALRADRNECVRHTAALTLNKGCCCTKKTIDALTICVSGSDADGHPCEKSARVRAAAAIALQACLDRACCPTCPIPPGAVPVEEPKKPVEEKPKGEGDEKKDGDKKDDKKTDPNSNKTSWAKPGPQADEDLDDEALARKTAKAYYSKSKTKTMDQLLARAKQVLETMPPLPLDLSIPAGHPDYEAAGVRTTGTGPSSVMDYISGAPAESAAKMTAKTDTTAKAQNALKQSKPQGPVNILDYFNEPKVAKTTTPVEAPKPLPAATAEPTPVIDVPKLEIKPADTKAEAAVESKVETKVETIVEAKVETKVESKPVSLTPQPMPKMTEPKPEPQPKMLDVKPAVIAAPKAEPKPIQTPKLEMKPAAPVEAYDKAAMAVVDSLPLLKMTHADRVMKMMSEPTDLLDLCTAVNALTESEMKATPKVETALLVEAEHPCPMALRVACLKALARSKTMNSDMATRLDKLATTGDKTLAAEAAATKQALMQ